MIIFLYGPDSYRLRQNSYSVLDNYRKKHPGGIFFKFDLSVADEIAKVEDAIKSGSLFGEIKLIVFKNVFSNKIIVDRIGELISSQNILKEKSIVLLFVESQDEKELVKNKNLFGLLTQKGNVIRKMEYLNGENLVRWIKNEFVLRKCFADADATKHLIINSGNDSWALINEVEKLCNFKTGGVIKKEDVSLLGFKKIDLNIFDFVDAIAGKNKAKAYEVLFKEIKDGRDPYYLLTMMVYGFRNMLAVKDLSDRGLSLSDITKKTKLHPFVAGKTYQSVGRFSLTELKSVYGYLFDLDTRSKDGTLDLSDSLYGFVLNI